jgi:hypothetical protein
MRKFAIFTAAAIGLAATPVLACDGRGKGGPSPEVRAEALSEADSDGNGALSATEFQAFKAALDRAHAAKKFAKLDADGDGQVTVTELEAGPPRRGADR